MSPTAPVIAIVCPGPGCTPVRGRDVYLAEAHPVTCEWMMRTARRCAEHDELLRPDEAGCPTPHVPNEWFDPHDRQRRGDRG
jgi:hypothetical protein